MNITDIKKNGLMNEEFNDIKIKFLEMHEDYLIYKIKKTEEQSKLIKIYFPNGKLRYHGELRNGKFYGKGKLYYQDEKIRYDGEFTMGKFDGYGKLYSSDKKIIYEGEFTMGFYEGIGRLFYPNEKIKYEGEFKEG